MKYISAWCQSGMFWVVLVFTLKVCGEGFVAGTLVKAIDRNIPIEALRVGDFVCCCGKAGTLAIGSVIALQSHEASKLIKLFFENETITCGVDQLLYCGESLGWRKAEDLQAGDKIVNATNNYSIVLGIETLHDPQLIYAITVEDRHNFYVSKTELLAHNVVFIAAAPVVMTALEAATAVSIVAGCIYSFFCKNSAKKHTCSGNSGGGENGRCICGHYCGAGCHCGCSCGCGNEIEWKKNTVSRQEFFKRAEIRENYEHVRNGIYQLKKGGIPVVKGANYLQWDHLHNDVEVYQNPKRHLGSLNPRNFDLYKGPVSGRKMSL